MKQLFVIRHAKSDQRFWGNDFERPLNDRGQSDAPMMAKRLLGKNYTIDALVSSPAERAKQTALLFADVLKIPAKDILLVSALYQASASVIEEVVCGLPNHLNNVAVFSHNPGITGFVNNLAAGARVDNMPTCSVFAVAARTGEWNNFTKAKKDFLFFDFPKSNL